jgi:hypothetical protein
MYAGPDPDTAVTTSIIGSSTNTASPAQAKSDSANARSSSVTPGPGAMPVMPLPANSGVLGIVRMTRCDPPVTSVSVAIEIPAMIEITHCLAGSIARRSSRIFGKTCGLTASSTALLSEIASVFRSVTVMPSLAKSSRLCSDGSAMIMFLAVNTLAWSAPRTIASAMLPPPMMPSCLLNRRLPMLQCSNFAGRPALRRAMQ